MRNIIVGVFLLISTLCNSQESTRKDSIKLGLLVPENITECFSFLDVIMKPKIESDSIFRENVFSFWHFGTGLWIRNNWLNKDKMRLYFNKFNRGEPDGTSGLIGRGYKEYLYGNMPNPEKWMKNNTLELPVYILNGNVASLEDINKINPESLYSINVIKTLSDFQRDIGQETKTILINTRSGWVKCDSILSEKYPEFKNKIKNRKIEDITFLYKNDTLKHFEMIGNEKKISLREIENNIFEIEIINSNQNY